VLYGGIVRWWSPVLVLRTLCSFVRSARSSLSSGMRCATLKWINFIEGQISGFTESRQPGGRWCTECHVLMLAQGDTTYCGLVYKYIYGYSKILHKRSSKQHTQAWKNCVRFSIKAGLSTLTAHPEVGLSNIPCTIHISRPLCHT
jgi:hypothetical protein